MNNSCKIKKLPEEVINKIAAGEVIERPLSIVKELLENSIDANSDEVNIEIKDGGKELIEITDNGIAMTKEELQLSVSRFATSKINNFEDIYKIKSYGFRGEALASILAVSDLTIKTKKKHAKIGYILHGYNSQIEYIKPISMNNGTTITVKDIFKNIPVRKKFLKSAKTEYSKIADFLYKLAIVNDNISFSFKSNNKLIFKVKKDISIYSRIKQLYKNIDTDKLIYGEKTTPFGLFRFFLSRLDYTKSTKNFQIFFINKRYIRDSLISSPIEEVYSEFTSLNGHPIVFAFLDIYPDLVDINIHPQKIQVKFLKPYEFKYSIKNCIREILNKEYSYKEQFYDIKDFNFSSDKLQDFKKTQTALDFQDFYFTDNNSIEQNFKILDVINNLYILILEGDTLYIVDQHNAHERIIYDNLKTSKKEQFQELLPIDISLPDNLYEFTINNIEKLKENGILIEKLSSNTLIIRGISNILKNIPITKEWFLQVIEELYYLDKDKTKEIDFLKTIACKSAIKRGEKLTINEYKNLWIQLKKTSNMYLCPHSRPITIRYSFSDLNKLFKRYNLK